ncbi:conserved hypothetical protein [Altererythrobacter sp. B11]|uniref:phospholipid carrier-dependent glycosyltransferase n=1 Tax=Altererythrobacter sp. B11 TaxID=2060312 RepID=UPI000DC6EC8C|nr:glycosyltransferase family 39 protein [Altererythrobacter sp. B11]BBC72385.1 conserved hypothetical protein [Altererythrobacter sp. B11]
MTQPPQHARDPIGWTAIITLVFVVLVSIRLTIPTRFFFDEVHYLPAARAVMALSKAMNVEHPPLGKQMIALGMEIFGDRALGWRITPAIFGTLAIFAAMRALWFASLSRFATLAGGVLILTAFPLLVLSRIAMLDIFMLGFSMLAMWMWAGALREHETARWRLAICGVALGCAMASKWNAVPMALLPGLSFLVFRVRAAGWGFLATRRGAPIGGMTLPEAALWLGLVPLVTYAACYWPFVFYEKGSITPDLHGLLELHRKMLSMQEQYLKKHTYMSVWYQWVFNIRPIWFLYENLNGAQRGVLMIGNPLTMIIGLPAILWCGYAGLLRKRWDALGVFAGYAASLGLWIIAPKNVQFYYHYALASLFLMGGLALALDELRRRGWTWVPLLVLAAAAALFAYFWPILSAASLPGRHAFTSWMWLSSWR